MTGSLAPATGMVDRTTGDRQPGIGSPGPMAAPTFLGRRRVVSGTSRRTGVAPLDGTTVPEPPLPTAAAIDPAVPGMTAAPDSSSGPGPRMTDPRAAAPAATHATPAATGALPVAIGAGPAVLNAVATLIGPPIQARDPLSRAVSRAGTTTDVGTPGVRTPVVLTVSAASAAAPSVPTRGAVNSIAAVRGPASSAATTRAATDRAATDRAGTTRATTVRAATDPEATARVPMHHAAVHRETIARAVMADATTHRARTSDAVTARVRTASAVDTSVRTIIAGTPRVIVGPPNRPARRAGVRAPRSAVT